MNMMESYKVFIIAILGHLSYEWQTNSLGGKCFGREVLWEAFSEQFGEESQWGQKGGRTREFVLFIKAE